eukprot:1157519-Pelagomonas_calceolata.AAC.2
MATVQYVEGAPYDHAGILSSRAIDIVIRAPSDMVGRGGWVWGSKLSGPLSTTFTELYKYHRMPVLKSYRLAPFSKLESEAWIVMHNSEIYATWRVHMFTVLGVCRQTCSKPTQTFRMVKKEKKTCAGYEHSLHQLRKGVLDGGNV